jgi:CBS domain-containing protein
MKVKDLMIRNVQSCAPEDNLATVAELLWTTDCGALPVVDAKKKLIGMITDRDVSIAQGTRNCRASELIARDVATSPAVSCGLHDTCQEVMYMMRQHQVRRIPVVENGELIGMLSLNDLVLQANKFGPITYDDVVSTMKAICQHRAVSDPTSTHVAA